VAGALRRRGARLGGRGGIGPLRALNLLRGALDARLHPELIEEGLIRMVERLRGSVLCVLYGYAAFVVAGIGYQKLTEYEDFTEAANRHAALGASFRTIVVASVVSMVSMVAAATPIGLATVRQALAGRRALWASLAVLAVA
jgi:ABC-type sulfate transport system permease component